MKKTFTAAALIAAAGAGVMVASSLDSRPVRQVVPPELGTVLTEEVTRRDNPAPGRAMAGRTMAGGTTLYGFVSDWELNPEEWWRPYRGVYEISEYGDLEKVYPDPLLPANAKLSAAFLLDGYLYGYAESYPDENDNWGDRCFAKVDFETGQVVEKVPATPGTTASSLAYNPEEGYFYYCTFDNRLCRATITNPAEVEEIKVFADSKQNLISIAWCPDARKFYGVTVGHQFVTMDTRGNITKVADIPSRGSHATYKAGLVWAPNEELFYWNYQGKSGTSSIYSITREGVFNLECSLENNACLDWLVTPDERFIPVAPESPVIDSLVFADAATSGTLTFTLPTDMQNGNPLPDEGVDWTVMLDGEPYKLGKDKPGSQVTVQLTDIETGNHEFGVYVTLDVFSCDPVFRRIWIGNDTPLAPTRVSLTKKAVTWEAPTGGIHGGYVDLNALSYEVVIRNIYGNDVFTGTTTGTSLEYTLEDPENLSYYTAYVTASCAGLSSSTASSAGIVMGDYLVPPVYLTPTQDEFRLMTVVDNNSDGNSWAWRPNYDGSLYSGASQVDIKPMNDYIFLPAMSFGSTERIYELTFDTSAASPTFVEEYLDVVLAVSPDYDGVIESLVDRTKVPCSFDRLGNVLSDWTHLDSSFKVPEAGIYYIGFHCSSASQMNGILVRNIMVNDGGVLSASPAAPTGVSATAAAQGVLEATVSFTFPTETVEGEPIPAGTALQATVSSGVASAEISGIPGGEAVVTLGTAQGDNEIVVVVTNPEGLNSPRGVTRVYTGQVVAEHVTNLRGVISDDMLQFALYWDAPTEGVGGGYIDPADITYNVYYYDALATPSNWIPLSKGQRETFYEFHPEEQDYWRLAIEAVNPAGASSMVSGSAWAGPAYKLPFEETFTSPTPYYETKPWRIITDQHHADWGFDYLYQIDPTLYGEDNMKIAMRCSGAEGTDGVVAMPRFSTEGVEAAHVTLDVYTGPRAAETRILGYTTADREHSYVVATLPRNEADGISKVTFDLPDFLLGQPWVQLLIEAFVDSDTSYFAMTGVNIDRGAGVSAVAGDASGYVAGVEGAVSFIGLDGAAATVATPDGRTVASGTVKGDNARWYLDPGVYVVTAGTVNAKILVK